MADPDCPHRWVAESTCHDSFHLIFCRNCGVKMSRQTLLTYLNAAEALCNIVNVVEEARASERAVRKRSMKEDKDG